MTRPTLHPLSHKLIENLLKSLVGATLTRALSDEFIPACGVTLHDLTAPQLQRVESDIQRVLSEIMDFRKAQGLNKPCPVCKVKHNPVYEVTSKPGDQPLRWSLDVCIWQNGKHNQEKLERIRW